MKVGILWDLDGTLLDTLDDLADSVNYALNQYGYPQRTREEIRHFVGNGARWLMALAVPAGENEQQVFDCFRKHYAEHCQDKTCPYAGIQPVLAELGEKYPMAIVSNKPDFAVKQLCQEHFPGLYARGETSDCPRKPAPDMVLKTMAEMGVETCIYVGDSEVDVQTAKNAGVPCLSVLWGFRDRDEIEKVGGIHFCDNVAELPRILDEMIRDLTAC